MLYEVITDLFNIYVTLELLGLAPVGLGAVEGRVPALTAALRYLLITLLGSGLRITSYNVCYTKLLRLPYRRILSS